MNECLTVAIITIIIPFHSCIVVGSVRGGHCSSDQPRERDLVRRGGRVSANRQGHRAGGEEAVGHLVGDPIWEGRRPSVVGNSIIINSEYTD